MEIERTLARFGASGFAYAATTDGRRRIEFSAHERHVRFELRLPDASDDQFIGSRDGWKGPSDSTRRDRQEAEHRRLWRALLLAIKAKLEVVESKIQSFESEFAAHIVMPDGRTVYESIEPQIAAAYARPSRFTRLMLTAGSDAD